MRFFLIVSLSIKYSPHRHPRGWKRPCKCHSQDRGFEKQDVCSTCAVRDVEEMQAARHMRFEQEARGIAFRDNAKCGKCHHLLKKGTRWWVCGNCNGECKDKIHPPYVGKSKSEDPEMGKSGGKEDPKNGRNWWKRRARSERS